jgi:DNA invertase Pin-like site-specific DNA recombinase
MRRSDNNRQSLGDAPLKFGSQANTSGGNWRIIAEFTEIESGKRSDRPALEKALTAARVHQVPLVVAKVDRLTRSVAFLSRLLEAGIDVRFADLPMIEGATGKFLLQQMAAVAELEAGMISARTKAALAAAKRRGVKLGGDRGARLTAKARAAGRAAVKARARNRALDLAPAIQELQAAGCESLRAIAAGLEDRGIPAPRGGKWSAVQVARLLEAASVPFDARDEGGRGLGASGQRCVERDRQIHSPSA